jgi:hypothetical protein
MREEVVLARTDQGDGLTRVMVEHVNSLCELRTPRQDDILFEKHCKHRVDLLQNGVRRCAETLKPTC